MSTITIPLATFDAMRETLEDLAAILPLDRDTVKTSYGVCNSDRDAIHAAITAAKEVQTQAQGVEPVEFGTGAVGVHAGVLDERPTLWISTKGAGVVGIPTTHEDGALLSPSDTRCVLRFGNDESLRVVIDELKKLYTTPQEPAAAALLKTLIEAREALQFANDSPKGPICDTIWMMHRPETLFDFLDVAIENATAAPGGAA